MLRALAFLLTLAFPAAAQETVVTGVSTDTVALNATFNGSELFIFGAIRREAPVAPEAAPLDVVIIIEGPPEAVVVRRKERIWGIWINAASLRIHGAPSFYAVASTRPVRQILSEAERLRHNIGIDEAVRLVGSYPQRADAEDFGDALARIRLDGGLYSVLEGGVRLAEDTLFQASFALPANLVEGDYEVRILLVRDGEVVSSGEAAIRVEKTGIERWIYDLAQTRPLAYGCFAIGLALAAGWLAASVFRLARR